MGTKVQRILSYWDIKFQQQYKIYYRVQSCEPARHKIPFLYTSATQPGHYTYNLRLGHVEVKILQKLQD